MKYAVGKLDGLEYMGALALDMALYAGAGAYTIGKGGKMKNILCIDVGGSRIKAAVLPKELDVNGLGKYKIETMRTLGWLNQSLPEIVSNENWASLAGQKKLSDEYSEIAICVPGPVRNGEFERTDVSVPRDLQRRLENISNKPVLLVKDADAWTAGAATFARLTNKPFNFPAVALAFGTGVGFSVACDRDRILSVEMSQWPWDFPSLQQASGQPIKEPWMVHHILGKQFFEWVDEKQKDWTYERIRNEFSNRVSALLKDTIPRISKAVGDVKTVIIGGGNSEFASVRSLQEQFVDIEVKSLWHRKVSVNTDIIPLLGLHQLAYSQSPTIEMFNICETHG